MAGSKQEIVPMHEVVLTYELTNPKNLDRVDRVLTTYKKKGSIETYDINETEKKISLKTTMADSDVCKILKTCTKKVDVVPQAAAAEAEVASNTTETSATSP
ncbi:Hypothetical protein NTJ_15533 [Nesidiocoris tenuis]|uniref:HMA domain-containing protein n=1 Tax=Nesidiocoris tenuis TaxID=355587 RepID=A0ABN7BEB5_9HEMI|nr:Hypothetical protein NTJ_15533 [Nesidiocoris tenuis]